MNRRTLIKGLLGAIFAGDILKELGAQAIKAITAPESAPEAPTTALRANPAWETAPYEVLIIRGIAVASLAGNPLNTEPFPRRFKYDERGRPVEVPAFRPEDLGIQPINPESIGQ